MYNFGFVMEQTLGHVTHHQNLARWVAEDSEICPTWMPIAWEQADLWQRFPVVRGNWSLRGSLRTRAALKSLAPVVSFDALFIHTQTLALFALPFMRRTPTLLSLDATPINYDMVGAEYGHFAGNKGWLEQRKYEWNQRTFQVATALVTWCQWAKDSLVQDYGIAPEKITVIPPGVDMTRWTFGREKVEQPRTQNGPLRLLFVGGDFARKGGHVLMEAFDRQLHQDCLLDIVTKDEATARALQNKTNVRVHLGLTANSPALRELYAQADLFVFPTLGDCLPIAVMEAMAAGLPVIATDVGALKEEVEDQKNGIMIPARDPSAVAQAVQLLMGDAARRHRMGQASRQMAEERFDARRNYNAVLTLMKQTCRR
jgi:glycosyltransferase involved in cell wall biosynthesis